MKYESTDKGRGVGQVDKETGARDLNRGDSLSVERYKSFIENIHDGVYEVDIHGNFTYFNNALCRVFGYPREEIQFQNFSRFMDEDRAREAFAIFNKIYKTGEGFSDLLWEIIDKEGSTRFIELSASLIRNRRGDGVGFRGIARDVTEKVRIRKALQESEFQLQCQFEVSRKAEKQYRTLLDFVPYPMVVFSLDGTVQYLNPAFTRIFGWTLQELQGKRIPYVPAELKAETAEAIKKLLDEKMMLRHETRRLTKDGRILDVIMRGTVFSEEEYGQDGQLVLLRDVSEEKRMARNNEALFRISTALPRYPKLEGLLDYIIGEVKQLLNAEGALVILLDEEKKEFFFQGAAYDDRVTQRKAKEIRFPMDKGITGRVLRTGKEAIVLDTSKDPDFYPVVDQQLGFHSRSMLYVPLRGHDRIIGVLEAMNKKDGVFDQKDVELMYMIEGTVALSIENARFANELHEALDEVTSLNRAKDKVINHLSHELKTPLSVLIATLNILSKKLENLPKADWVVTIERARRNLDRILEIQYQVEDIMQDRHYRTRYLLTMLLNECADELEVLVVGEVGEGPLVERIRRRIDEVFGFKESEITEISLDRFVGHRLDALKPKFLHRQIEIFTKLDPAPSLCIPWDVLQKVVDGIIKNAIEATPDEGRIEIFIQKMGEGCQLVVHDYGIGVTEQNQKRIFEGFFTTQETMAYSSKRPFDFNAGGKGADLLRMKIFAERYHFRIDLKSTRCPFLTRVMDACPGRISACSLCKDGRGCHQSGGTTVTVFFPAAPEKGCLLEDEVRMGRGQKS